MAGSVYSGVGRGGGPRSGGGGGGEGRRLTVVSPLLYPWGEGRRPARRYFGGRRRGGRLCLRDMRDGPWLPEEEGGGVKDKEGSPLLSEASPLGLLLPPLPPLPRVWLCGLLCNRSPPLPPKPKRRAAAEEEEEEKGKRGEQAGREGGGKKKGFLPPISAAASPLSFPLGLPSPPPLRFRPFPSDLLRPLSNLLASTVGDRDMIGRRTGKGGEGGTDSVVRRRPLPA